MRAVTWRLLSGYLPTSLERRNPVLERKRIDYQALVKQYFHIDARDESQQDTFRQIHIDVPRMNPHVPLFQQKLVQEMFERILFIWAIRHPASGYVQGINDLVTPFFIVFLQEQVGPARDLETYRLEELPEEQRDMVEADSFWCISKFLDCIQDNYIFAQLGIQEKVNQLKELIQRIDGEFSFAQKPMTVLISFFRSDASQTSTVARRRLSPVLVPVDEQLADTRAAALLHNSALGHLSGRVGRLCGVPALRVRCLFASLA